ncbi:MAG: wax ester/triacylglycerol synthase family O-acyltransferase [Blastocatellia bacterium]|nr:wax ester/triacylglycerol synthase family O-acyltransferase [Blastocatellia bacterium]
MKHLTGVDATFLYLETPETPMHVGSLSLFDLPDGYQGDFYEEVKAHVVKRMHLAPVFTRKLELMPFELANPIWVDDDDIDLDYHVRRIILPKPGTMEQLETYVGRLHSSLLDRSRPLWEFYIIEGLSTGQIAFYSKIHHAAIDGQAGVAVAHAILDVTPQPREVKPPPTRRRAYRYQLGVAELVQAALTNMAAQYAKLAFTLPKTVKTIGGAILPKKDKEGKFRFKWMQALSLGPRTPLNVSITNQRLFAGLSIPLPEIKRLAKLFHVTLNDVVLALCSGALRRYLQDGNYDGNGVPEKPLVAACPVSLREMGNTELKNQVAMMLCNLATNLNDPLERLSAIRESTMSAKESFADIRSLIPTDFSLFGAPWLMSGLASLYGRSRLANSIPPLANVVISNVPGPQFPLYLVGAKMATYYPVSIVVHGLALNITVVSYHGNLDFGLTACRRTMPDVKDLARYIQEEFDELKLLAASENAKEATPEPESIKRSLPAVTEETAAPAPKPRLRRAKIALAPALEPAANPARPKPVRRKAAPPVAVVEADPLPTRKRKRLGE